jgi:hypothetical protein
MRSKIFNNLLSEEDQECICVECIEDKVLRRAFANSPVVICHQCKRRDLPGVRKTVLANASRSIVQYHFRPLSEDELPAKNQKTLADVLKVVNQVTGDGFCEVMAEYLSSHPRSDENGFFNAGKKYVKIEQNSKKDKALDALQIWRDIATDLLHRQRYFNAKAEKFFEVLFDEAIQTKTSGLFEDQPSAIKVVPSNTIIFRARRIDNEADRNKIANNASAELGAPPRDVAAQNRMNPRGIPLFYGAADLETAIAEIRPSIGDDVAVGKFRTTKALKLFNFLGLNIFPVRPKLSYWYDDYELRLPCRELLSYLHHAVSQPVRVGETGYIVTQAMTEYLCHKNDERFDGIIFSSVQNDGGVNYVLFSEDVLDESRSLDRHELHFPVTLSASPAFHKVSRVKYSGNW